MVFEYSFWWLLPIIGVAGFVAYLKYRKLTRLPDIGFTLAVFISSLRFLVILVLLFLLLHPALSFVKDVREKPLLVIAQDNSVSIGKTKDSLYYRSEYKESLDKLVATLEKKFDVKRLTFGMSVKKGDEIDFLENHTDIAGVFDYTERNYMLKRPEAMILLTDGIYNTGVNPRYKLTSYPVFAVCLGDTVTYPDIYVKSIECDKFNFINTIFPIKAEIAALKQKGNTVKCVLRENGNKIAEEILNIDSDNYLGEVVFEAEAKQKGVARYTISSESVAAERTRDNNQATAYVNIIDNTGDISVFYAAPHPDIAAIVNAVNVSGIYRCSEYSLADRLPEELKSNLIILHNPEPGNPNYQQIIELAAKRKIALWYVLTNRESITDFARYGKNYTVEYGTDINEYTTVDFNKSFPYFEFTDQEINGFSQFPPLVVPFGELKGNAGRLLFTQKIKNTPTNNGVIGFYDNNGNRICYFWGEGLWKWRLYSYKENGNHELFNTLVNKIVNYLAAQRGTERFIHDTRPLYDEMEETLIHVELYNDSYELVNTPDVNLHLKFEDKEFDYILNRDGDKYRINLGNLPAGEYSYRFSTDLKGERFEKKGVFYVKNRSIELNNMVADKQLLREVAANSGGEVFTVDQMEHLTNVLNSNDDFRPVYKSEVKYIELSELTILGLILILLLCTEWFLLKYFAG